jgi:hypothetical protein
MSVFQVSLNNISQGTLDLNPSVLVPLNAEMEPSIQRTVYVTGPKGIYRKLKDGDTFTDCNYWKKFAYPQVPQTDAFIIVLEDDGSVYSDIPEENNFPRVYTLNVNDGTTYDDNVVDILGDNGGTAHFIQIHNLSGGGNIKVRLNGTANAIFDLESGNTQIFNYGDLSVTKLEFHNESGDNSVIQTIVSIRSIPNS